MLDQAPRHDEAYSARTCCGELRDRRRSRTIGAKTQPARALGSGPPSHRDDRPFSARGCRESSGVRNSPANCARRHIAATSPGLPRTPCRETSSGPYPAPSRYQQQALAVAASALLPGDT
jgi:hypothetical protein